MGICGTQIQPDTEETKSNQNYRVKPDEENRNLLNDLRREFDSIENVGNLPFIFFSKTCDNKEKEIDQTSNTIQTEQCNIDNCDSLQRISDVLKKHHTFIQQQAIPKEAKSDTFDDNKEEIKCDVFDDEYNVNDALNNYHHLLFCHETDFEYIYNKLIKDCFDGDVCSLKGCPMIHRNYVNPSHFSGKQLDDDILKETVHNQILDKIHCYYLHTFDIGYKLREKDRENLIIQEMKCNENVKQRDNIIFDRIFVNAQHFIAKNSTSCTDELKSNCFKRRNERFNTETTEIIYDIGVRYFYWSYYKNNEEVEDVTFMKNPHGENFGSVNAVNDKYCVGEWYIEKKHDDLKDELLNNSVRTIYLNEYKTLSQAALEHYNSMYAKSLTAFGNDAYGISDGAQISIKHLLAMMAYCNKDELQRDFSETYRRRKDETDDSLKKRHANYANFGKLLREFTDCYGQTNIGNKEVGTTFLWHGISKQTQFASIKIRIKGPCSSTTDCCVACNFAGGEGLILQFTLTHRWMYGNEYNYSDSNQCAFVDCHWLSDFPNEQERFFIGGYDYFYVESIVIPKGENYQYYIQAMRTICETMQDSNKWFLSSIPDRFNMDIITQTAFRLLSHELHQHYPENTLYHPFKQIPPYIAELFHNFCVNTERIVFFTCPDYDYCIEYSYDKMKKICYSLFFYDSGLIKFDVVLRIFPSIKGIWIKGNCNGQILDGQNIRLISMTEFWGLLLDLFVIRGDDIPIIEVDLYPAGIEERIIECRRAVQDANDTYAFESSGWSLFLDENCDHLLIQTISIHDLVNVYLDYVQ